MISSSMTSPLQHFVNNLATEKDAESVKFVVDNAAGEKRGRVTQQQSTLKTAPTNSSSIDLGKAETIKGSGSKVKAVGRWGGLTLDATKDSPLEMRRKGDVAPQVEMPSRWDSSTPAETADASLGATPKRDSAPVIPSRSYSVEDDLCLIR